MGSSAFNSIVVSSKCEFGIAHKPRDNEHQKSPAQVFFEDVWQKQPTIYVRSDDKTSSIISFDWDDIATMLQHCTSSEDSTDPPLFFQNGIPITDPHTIYNANPFSAYLDGCSIIVNHADFHHQKIAGLCDNLQQTFPHAYANAYLTPASSHAVKAHADDRDVLVIQVFGKKKWKVYENVPIQYPFTKEQVGKYGNKVDSTVLDGGLCFNNKEMVLSPGDVLYLPRGYVHEASCEDEPSFHITVALATHDWCMSVLLSNSIRQTLDQAPQFRRALPIGPSEEYERATTDLSLKQQLDEAMSIIQNKVDALVLEENIRAKYQMHNTQANDQRKKLHASVKSKKRKSPNEECVGSKAASSLTLNSSIRVSTPEERSCAITEGAGLTVREENLEAIMKVLSKLKSDPGLSVGVKDLRGIVDSSDEISGSHLCDFTLLSFAKVCVELGALAVVDDNI